MVVGSIGSLKVALGLRVRHAKPAGETTITVGGTKSPVTKLHEKLLASGRPRVSCAAVVTVATHVVLLGNGADGASVATFVVAS